MSLADTPEWQRMTKAWQAAAEITSGKRGAYPFDTDEKTTLIEHLGRAIADIGDLVDAGALSRSAGALLSKEIDLLIEGVAARRTKQERDVAGYRPVLFTPERDSLARLLDRAPLLEALADEATVDAQAVQKIAAAIRRDVDALAEDEDIAKLPDDQRAEAVEVRDRMSRMLHRLATATTASS